MTQRTIDAVATSDAVVIGGGLAGAAAAAALAQAGRDVLLLERTARPAHKICGEFLSTEAQAALEALGLDVAALGGHAIARLGLARGADHAVLDLPFQGLGLSRLMLDEALLAHAVACGARLQRGCAVQALHAAPAGGHIVDLGDAGTLRANTVFLATGKHDLRGARRQTARPPEALVGFKMYFALSDSGRRALAGRVDILLFAQGYAGLQMVEEGRANLTLLVARDWLAALGGHWDALLPVLRAQNARLDDILHGATALLDRPITISRVPYGFVHDPSRAAPTMRSLYRLGDQMAVIPSFSGDGMAIALHSAQLAARMEQSGQGAEAYHRQMRADVAGQVRRADWLYRLGRARLGQALLLPVARLLPTVLRRAALRTRVQPRTLVTPPRATPSIGRRVLLPLLLGATLLPAAARADTAPGLAVALASPVGLWRTYDDKTGQPRGMVRITQQNGALVGVVAGSANPNEVQHNCDVCTGDLHGKPLGGMQIMQGLRPDGKIWDGGTIMDPDTGIAYGCSVRLIDGGQRLVVRGFLGISLLGRSQTWQRME